MGEDYIKQWKITVNGRKWYEIVEDYNKLQ